MVYQILIAVGAVVMALAILFVTLTSKKQPRARIRYWDFISITAVFLGRICINQSFIRRRRRETGTQ